MNVIARLVIIGLLLSSTAPLTAQTSPPLEAAERALVNALMRPDKDAFRELIASDAVFFVPAEAHGPDAIVEKWRPFLSDTAARVALTIESSTTAATGEAGQTSGTFAVYARTNHGMSTTPAGSFFISWRLVDGRWKIGTMRRFSSETARRASR